MIIQCPRCSTRWRVGDPSGTDNPVFKCGRCHHVFPQFPGAPPAAERAAGRARSAPPEPDNLEFIFPRRTSTSDAASAAVDVDTIAPLREIVHDPPREAPATTQRATETMPPTAAAADDPTHELPAAADDPIPRFAAADELPAADREIVADDAAADEALLRDVLERDLLLADEDGGSARERRPPAAAPRAGVTAPRPAVAAQGPSSETDTAPRAAAAPRVLDVEAMMGTSARIPAARSATRLLLTLVAAFALLALFVRANPERVEAWLGRLPIVGGALAAEPALSSRITLSEVHGGYQQLRSGRRIFVISGKATNDSLVPVERIEVQGELYAASGAVARKVISTGNRTTLKLRDLSEAEIALLQNLDARQAVAPGGSVEFAIAFLEPPRDLREFSSRVLTARSTSRGASPPAEHQGPASVG